MDDDVQNALCTETGDGAAGLRGLCAGEEGQGILRRHPPAPRRRRAGCDGGQGGGKEDGGDREG